MLIRLNKQGIHPYNNTNLIFYKKEITEEKEKKKRQGIFLKVYYLKKLKILY